MVLIGLIASACGPQAQVRMAGNNTASLAMDSAPYNQARSIGSIMLCLTSPSIATITGVSPHDPFGSIHVDAFAVRPNPFAQGLDGLGDDARPLDLIGSGFDPNGPQQVSGVCPTDAQMNDTTIASKMVELGVQVSWSTGDIAGTHGLDVTYEIGGAQATALIPFGIWLCASACPRGVGS